MRCAASKPAHLSAPAASLRTRVRSDPWQQSICRSRTAWGGEGEGGGLEGLLVCVIRLDAESGGGCGKRTGVQEMKRSCEGGMLLQPCNNLSSTD